MSENGMNGSDDHIDIQLQQQSNVTGYHEANTFGGARLGTNVAKIGHQYPKMGNDILNGFSRRLGTTSLSYREWALVTISALTSLGDCSDQLNVYVQGALRHGAHVDEILDLLHHAQGFVGNPRAIEALRDVWNTIENAQILHETPRSDGYREFSVKVGDHDTLVRDTGGNGVPVVFVHALCVDSIMFKDLASMLASKADVRVITYDLRGHGYARGAPLTKSLEHLCEDLLKLFDILGIEQADVCGASYGGAVAQSFALEYPSRVRSLVPMATFGKGLPVMITRASRAEENGVMSLLPETIIRWFRPETVAANPWCVRYARNCIARARLEEWVASWEALSSLNILPRLIELKIPVMILSGSHDPSATPSIMKELADAYKNADVDFVSIDGGSHMMAMEQTENVAEKMTRFRNKVDGVKRKVEHLEGGLQECAV